MDGPTALLTVSGSGGCRNCMFSVKDQLGLERAGLGGRVRSRHLGPERELGWSFLGRVWSGIVGWDLLTQLAAYHRPYERREGECDRLHAMWADELVARLERPPAGRAGALWELVRGGIDLSDLIERASEDYAALRARGRERPSLRTVLLSGDIYVRLDDVSNDGLPRRLAERGIRPIVEPISVLSEHLAEEGVDELVGMPSGPIENALVRTQMRRARRVLYALARRAHPWLPEYEPATVRRLSRELIGRQPVCEAPATVGSVLHAWRAHACDGVVLASPWGCGPALLAESLLRHEREIPMLFLYTDGSPIDERRIDAFAFRLRRAPPRARAQSGREARDAAGTS